MHSSAIIGWIMPALQSVLIVLRVRCQSFLESLDFFATQTLARLYNLLCILFLMLQVAFWDGLNLDLLSHFQDFSALAMVNI
jgi:hypothetical protein